MPDDILKTGAKEGDSPDPTKTAAKSGDSPSPEELKAELERKTNELTASKSKVAELERLRDESGLSKEEEDELADERDNVRKIADKIRKTKEFQPFEVLIKEEAQEAALRVELNADIIRANHLLEDWAVEEGFMKPGVGLKEAQEKMAQAIAPFLSQFSDQIPSRRNQLAYRAFKAEQKKLGDLDKREKTLKEREDEAQRFRETGRRGVGRDESALDKVSKARTPTEKAAALTDLVATAASQT